jgi:Protein of unknown function (DUF1501)
MQSSPTGIPITRREMLTRAGGGLGMLALADLLNETGRADYSAPDAREPLAPRAGHFPARAKAVIWLYMYGAPSGIDTFDPKPELDRRHGQRLPGKIDVLFGNPGPLMRSPFKFSTYGKTGTRVSELFPNVANHVDDLTFLKACTANSNNHAPALLEINTGVTRVGRPSAGAWVTYGLGSVNRNLPGYVVMHDHRSVPVGGAPNWGAGFLPAAYQGVPFRPGRRPLLYLERPAGTDAARQRAQLDLLKEFNERHRAAHPGEAELEGRIESFELAYRMQSEAPEAVSLDGETEATRKLYGMDNQVTEPYGSRLLLARRLVERGVRFVQVYSGGTKANWDAHDALEVNHRQRCEETDKPIAGLLQDLKQRGLLKDTLVIWGAEFGRMPISQGSDGRDHNPNAFLMWLAGGGVKAGFSYGASDDLGYMPAKDPVSVHDFHATLLHLLGLDHKRLSYEHDGRSFRLTDVSGRVVEEILA